MGRTLRPTMHHAQTDPILRRARTTLRNPLQHAENAAIVDDLHCRRVRNIAAGIDDLAGDGGCDVGGR